MKRLLPFLVARPTLDMLLQANDEEEDRLENCGMVIQEIMDIPDDIPQDLIDKRRLHHRLSIGGERRIHLRRQLRPRRDDLPHR